MSNRRDPIETALTSSVIYPSGIFSLEKDEVFPYERFAYNVLDVGVGALSVRDLPESLTVDFSLSLPACSPWSINAGVSVDRGADGQALSYRVSTPEFFPAILYMFSAIVTRRLFDDASRTSFMRDPKALVSTIQRFVDGASAGVRAYRERGIAHAIRAGYDHLGLQIMDLQQTANDFDLLSKQVAYHEVGHAYAKQLMHGQGWTPVQRRGFELIADLLGTEWLYNGFVRNTPDTDEYREFRGLESYKDTIYANAMMSIRAQQANLILAALAGAQLERGPMSLAGGETHPPGFQRYHLQHVHLYTLIASNFADTLSDAQLAAIEQDWSETMEILVGSGVLPVHDLGDSLDLSHCHTIDVAADLIEKQNIAELQKAVPLLRETRKHLEKLLQERGI